MYEHLTDEQLKQRIEQESEAWRISKKNTAIDMGPGITPTLRFPPELERLWEEERRRRNQKEQSKQLRTLLIIAGVISLILYFVLG